MATELEVAQEQLTQCRAAISAVLTGSQSYSLLGRSWTRADLKELRQMERDLMNRVARQSRGGIKIQRAIPL